MDPSTTPLLPPPPGVTSDFTSGLSSLQVTMIVVYATTLGVATVLLAIRLYTVIHIISRVGIDDGMRAITRLDIPN